MHRKKGWNDCGCETKIYNHCHAEVVTFQLFRQLSCKQLCIICASAKNFLLFWMIGPSETEDKPFKVQGSDSSAKGRRGEKL